MITVVLIESTMYMTERKENGFDKITKCQLLLQFC